MTNLTDKWKKGELDRNKIYYYETPFNTVDTASGYWLCNHLDTEKDKVEILGEVPSYEEYQKFLSDQLAKNEGVEINAELEAENTKLKENIHSMLFTDDVVQDRYDKSKEENTKLKTENKWYSEQLNEAVKEVAKLKKLLKEARNVLKMVDTYSGDYDSINGFLIVEKINQVLGEE